MIGISFEVHGSNLDDIEDQAQSRLAGLCGGRDYDYNIAVTMFRGTGDYAWLGEVEATAHD